MDTAFEAVFVARQPIFTPSLDVWGYELLFRTSIDCNTAIIEDGERATASVLADGLVAATQDMPQGRKILVNFPEALLASEAAYALPVDLGVVEILETVSATEETFEAVRELRAEGYTIALDDYTGAERNRPLLKYADIVKVDILELGSDAEAVKKVVETIPEGKLLLAEKVEDRETFEMLKQMGFTLFQGFFFSKPEILEGRKLSSGELSRLQIMEELGREEVSLERISEILGTDPSLSYRLFRYINSASFGLSVKVNSVERAVAMLGIKQITQWLKSAILSDMAPSQRGAELAFLSVLRAKFLELLCDEANACSIPDPLFITGLFSLLDAMLDIRMKDILETLPLDQTVVDALTGKSKLHKLLMLAHSYERGYWADCDRRMKALGLKPERVNRLYAQSRNWAAQVMGAAR